MKPPRTWLIVTSAIFGSLGSAGIAGAFMSLFLFDAPGSQKLAALWVLFWSLLTFPVVCAATIGASWIAYALKWFSLARIISLVPFANIVCGGSAFFWIAVLHRGRFS